MPPMMVNETIARLVPGRSFIDVGGLWGTENERVSIALKAGARSATMLDIQPAGNQSWQEFEAHCAALGVGGYHCIEGNLDDPGLPDRIGRFDVVHCSGVIYHCPDLFHSLRQLARITNRHLLLCSMTVPALVENEAGVVDFRDGRIISVPALTGQAREVMARYFDSRHIKVHNINMEEPHPWMFPSDVPNYSPWWWLWTPQTLASLVDAVGFHVLETFDGWPGYSHYLLCEKRS